MADRATLYRALIKEAEHRDEVFARFTRAGHPDAAALFNFHNGVVKDLVRDYKEAGGKRPVERFITDNKDTNI